MRGPIRGVKEKMALSAEWAIRKGGEGLQA